MTDDRKDERVSRWMAIWWLIGVTVVFVTLGVLWLVAP